MRSLMKRYDGDLAALGSPGRRNVFYSQYFLYCDVCIPTIISIWP
jgi:hypothetical protein